VHYHVFNLEISLLSNNKQAQTTFALIVAHVLLLCCFYFCSEHVQQL